MLGYKESYNVSLLTEALQNVHLELLLSLFWSVSVALFFLATSHCFNECNTEMFTDDRIEEKVEREVDRL